MRLSCVRNCAEPPPGHHAPPPLSGHDRNVTADCQLHDLLPAHITGQRPAEQESQGHPVESNLVQLCIEKGMRMTEQRRVIAQVLSDAEDHPDVEELYRRASGIDDRISIATVYRTVRLFEDAGILERHEFRDGRARYEQVTEEHHDHLIDLQTGKVIEFRNEDLERLQELIAGELGFKLVDHRLELYGVPLTDDKD